MTDVILRKAIEKVERLIFFYQQFPNLTLDAMDSTTEVTISDLGLLLTRIKELEKG